MYEEFTDRAFSEKVRNSDNYKWFVDNLLEDEADFSSDIRAEKYSEYKLFFETGNREIYQAHYFDKRRRMNTYAMLSLIYSDRTDYIEKLQDALWAVCSEYSWVLPAHEPNGADYDDSTIDLFAAETAFALSEIAYILKGRLAPLVLNRIKAEVKRRVIDVYVNKGPFFWETNTGNWSSVCVSHVAGAIIYNNPKLFEQLKPRIDKTLEYFFSGFRGDGACAEGAGYWQYGFGSFVCYADLAYEYSDGKYNYFQGEKLKEIAMFLQRCMIQSNMTTSFADFDANDGFNIGLLHMLKSRYPKDIVIPELNLTYGCNDRLRWSLYFRSLIRFNPDYIADILPSEAEHYFKDTQWFIKRTKSYGFAAKGGNNNEPHNHNDVGTFIYAKNGNQILCDIGSGEYTRQYFGLERYSIFCNSSLGHNVPIINDSEQGAGENYNGSMSVSENKVNIDITGAYDAGVKTVRQFELYEDRIVLCDSFKLGVNDTVTERFVSFIKPVVKKDTVIVGEAVLSFNQDFWEPHITVVEHIDHKSILREVYCIDFSQKEKTSEFIMNIQ